MKGRRIESPFRADGGLIGEWPSPGDYFFFADSWRAVTPNGHYGDLSNHTVVEHQDGTITVSPSILVNGGKADAWHGYLERGVWREC